jgi:hypothetical protein
MFLVPTVVAPSPIHGFGVFTPLPIPAGTVIWEFTPGVDMEFTADQVAAFPDHYRDRIEMYSYVNDEGVYILCGDQARFMNHADTPNCDDSGTVTRAIRDLAAGEELTCDYRSFDRLTRDYGTPALAGAVR